MTGSIHATAFVLGLAEGPKGVLVSGPSGSGKSALALAAIAEFRREGRFGALVADDRVILEASNGALLARAPDRLAGLVEHRGLGIVSSDHLREACIRLHAQLVNEPERMPEPARCVLEGVEIPLIRLPAWNGPHGTGALALLRAALQRCT